jgi:hypothetical protein
MTKVSSKTVLGADVIAQKEMNPNTAFLRSHSVLAPLRKTFEECAETFDKISAERGCSCRVRIVDWGAPFFDELFKILLDANKTNHTLVRWFINIMLGRDTAQSVDGVTLIIPYKEHRHEIFTDTSEDA